MRKEIGDRIVYTSPSWDVFGRLQLLPIAAVFLVGTVGCSLAIYSSVMKFEERPVAYALTIIFFFAGLCALLYTGFGHFKNAKQIALADDRIYAFGALGQRWEIPYSDISRVHRASIYGKHGKLLFVIGWTDSWGELIETVVERAINATAIDLKEGPQEEDSWGKQPDWDLINRAVRRADGNRQG